MVTVHIVIKLPCAKGSAPGRFVHTIGILGRPVLYFCGDFISGSSGTAVGDKGLNAIAKCASCKNKCELQACTVCDEPKCSVCAQEHQTIFEEKSEKIQTRLNQIRHQTDQKRHILLDFQQRTNAQLSHLEDVYQRLIAKLGTQYEEFKQQLTTSKAQVENQLNELEERWNTLERNPLFQQFINMTHRTGSLFTIDISRIETLMTIVEDYPDAKDEYDLVEFSFSPNSYASLGELLRNEPNNGTKTYTIRKRYYTQLTSTPRITLDLSIHARYIAVHSTSIFICNLHGNVQVYEYKPPVPPYRTNEFKLSLSKQFVNILCFTLTASYIVTHEKRSQQLLLHNHQGQLLNKIQFVQQVTHILSSPNDENLWICGRGESICQLFHIDSDKNLRKMQQIKYDEARPLRLCRTRHRFLVHDSRSEGGNNKPTQDNLLIYETLNFSQGQFKYVSLDFLKDPSKMNTSRLFHPIVDDEGFVVIKNTAGITDRPTQEELVVIDTNDLNNPTVIKRISMESMFAVTFTVDNELMVGINTWSISGKIYIY